MKELSQIEKLLNEDNTENVILYDEKNQPTEFEQVAIIPLYEKIFVILKPVTPIENMDDDEALVFVIEEIDDQDSLVIVEDINLVNEVFDEYYKLLKDEGII